MDKMADQRYLHDRQYRDSSNLDARARLHAGFSVNPYSWQRWVITKDAGLFICR